MKKIVLTLVLAFIGLYISANQYNLKYQKVDDGIILNRNKIITKITVVKNDVIHVEKYLNGINRRIIPDLVGVLKPQKCKWKVRESSNKDLVIETSKVNVVIDNKEQISYFKNKSLKKHGVYKFLSENNYRTYIKTDTLSKYQISQTFDCGDEGLYGLGQFQSGIMNWKSVPVRLLQSNQEIAVPVLISTKNYGIFWNNYSVTDFNYPDNELIFDDVKNKETNTKTAIFVPKESGQYSFVAICPTPGPKNRRLGRVILSCDKDTIIFYDTMWKPDSFSGKIDLVKGEKYTFEFTDYKPMQEGHVYYNTPSFNKTVFSSRRGTSVDYYFIAGDNLQDVASTYYSLTGHAPLFPKSSYGFWQCREAYQTQKGLLKSATEYRKKGIPVDNIVQDWRYWKIKGGHWCPEWDRSRYPDPKAMTDSLSKMNINLMVSVWPQVSNKELTKEYGFTYLKGSQFVDLYKENNRKYYYKMLSDSMFNVGVKSIWLDGSEPARAPSDDCQTIYGNFKNVANIYSEMVTKAVYEGHLKEFPNKRLFNLTRSSFAGQQKYNNAVWSGDVAGTWEQFGEQIAAGLNITIAGIPYWTTDIGGFFRDEKSGNHVYEDQYTDPNYRELLTRWFEYGTFCPIFRIHGFRTETEIWKFGPEFEKIARKYINLRYQLMPYIYSQAWNLTKNGHLIMSPLVYQYPNDKHVWDIKDQFLFGESMMICPVVNYKQRSRKVYLPKGNWYNFWTNEKIEGGRYITANAKIDEMPIFVKAGSIIPFGPKIQYAMQKTNQPITLRIYPGKDSEYTLYTDDGVSNNYKKGDYRLIKIKYKDKSKKVKVDKKFKKYSVEIIK